MSRSRAVTLSDCGPTRSTMRDEVLAGLAAPQKRLPCKYFYDRRGSELFERICHLDEYYLTRTELAILEHDCVEMAERLGNGCMLVEYGSGSSRKTRLLLDELHAPAAYVPVDISGDHLRQTAGALNALYPDLEVLPIVADFTQPFVLPTCRRRVARRAVYFPGSTIGNFGPAAATRLLQQISDLVGQGGGLLIGVDLKKDPALLQAAYSDRLGVTREFNLNLLARLNRELGADFEPAAFEHRAVWNAAASRMESHLVSRSRQQVAIDETPFQFAPGETIHTENSYKYDLDQFARLAHHANLTVDQVWTDPNDWFSVQYLTAR